VTDRIPPWEPQEALETFRADLPRVRRRRFGRTARAIAAGLVSLVLLAVLGAAFVKLAWLSDLPTIPKTDALWSLNRAPGVTFLDRNGVTIATRGPRHGRRVALAQLPAYAPRAFLAAEDRRFYRHGPFDWQGLGRAAVADVRAGGVVQGGSSLTQQLAKTLFLKPEQTAKRKVQEAALAIELERRMSKDQLLELYLNRVYFGASAYGLEAASQTYFGKPASALTLPEAALLAALPKKPSRLSPAVDMPGALARAHTVLRRMAAEGWISITEEQQALAVEPKLAPESPEDEDFGYVLDYAQTEAARLSQGKAPDLVVQLSIDAGVQTAAAQIVRDEVQTRGRQAGAREAALVALAPDGGVRALVGGVDHRFSRFDRAMQAQRQPGSAFKPFVYAAALEGGVQPTDIRKDAPVRLGPWTPANYGGGYRGPVTVEEALVRSINTVAVRLAKEAGPERIGDIDQRFGLISIPARPGLAVALGAYETNLLELTSGYQVFQQDGRRITPHLIEKITTSAGQEVWSPPPSPPRQVYDQVKAAQMVRMLEAVVQRGTGVRAAFGRPAAGKTGTSQSWRDAWFVGFTPDWVCGVWVGNDDDRPMNHVTGGDVPAEIWRRFMLGAHQGLPPREFPFLGGGDSAHTATGGPAAESRTAFYRGLAADFAGEASGDGPKAAQERP
jgi:penicillin-binding protein 1A